MGTTYTWYTCKRRKKNLIHIKINQKQILKTVKTFKLLSVLLGGNSEHRLGLRGEEARTATNPLQAPMPVPVCVARASFVATTPAREPQTFPEKPLEYI